VYDELPAGLAEQKEFMRSFAGEHDVQELDH